MTIPEVRKCGTQKLDRRYTDFTAQSNIGPFTKGVLLIFALGLIALIGILDYKTEENISFYVFYSLPILIAAWYLGGWGGLLACFASSAAWWIVDLKDFKSPQFIHYVDATIRLIFFGGISLIISFLHESLVREKNLADTDFLTGLPNRRTFIERVTSEIQKAKKHNRSFTIAYLDLDNFKPVNDQYGHPVGDSLLKQIATSLKNNVRLNDVVARMGGDEFVIFLPNTNEKEAVAALAHLQICLDEISERLHLPVTFTIGAVTYEQTSFSTEDMIKAADRVMYSGKRDGKNTIKHIHAKDLSLRDFLPTEDNKGA